MIVNKQKASTTVRVKLILVAILALSGCDKKSDKGVLVTNKKAVEVLASTNGYTPEVWPQRELTPARDVKIEKCVYDILMKMSLEEKVGQIIQPELKYATPSDVRKYHLGSVLNGGGTTPNNDKFASMADWANLAEQYYQASMDESDGNVGIPIIWGSDAVHGNNNLYGATVFPHNIGLGAAADPDLIYRIGQATALEVVATGVNWTFAPTVAVARDIRWGRTYESYSEDPKIVGEYASEMVRGIQGQNNQPGVFNPNHVAATAKHFLGDGGTTSGIDRGDTEATEQELLDIHAAGYLSALDGNVLTAMASFNSWNGKKIHGHEYLLTKVLKERLGFDGFLVSDWNGHGHIPGCTVEDCPAAINAGIDLVMVVEDWKAFYENTIKAVQQGKIPMARLDDAVSRILRVKLIAGLFDVGSVLGRPNVGDSNLVGSAEHRALAREAVRKSLVLLKNNNNVLPLSAKSNILVAGDAANNIGKQAGGWTLSWQGTGNTNADFPGATSIYAGIEEAVSAAGGNVHLSETGKWDERSFPNGAKPDAIVFVFGEEPYAEWHGDLANIEYQYGTKRDLALLKSFQELDVPVVSVFISGRPLWTNKEINASAAFVAAWLPGSQGAGVADVLLKTKGDQIHYDFQGRLSFSWPKSVTQAKLNIGQADYDPLFPYGYGLNYANSAPLLGELDESSQRIKSDALDDMWVFVSRAITPWEFRLADQGSDPVVATRNTVSSGDDDNLVMTSVDKASQEDARRLIWKGVRPATMSLATDYPQDMGVYLAADSALKFSLKVNQMPTSDVVLTMQCGDDCKKSVSLTNYLKKPEFDIWRDISINLSCFAANNADLGEVTEVFVMGTAGVLDVSLSGIKIVPGSLTNNDEVEYDLETILCDLE